MRLPRVTKRVKVTNAFGSDSFIQLTFSSANSTMLLMLAPFLIFHKAVTALRLRYEIYKEFFMARSRSTPAFNHIFLATFSHASAQIFKFLTISLGTSCAR